MLGMGAGAVVGSVWAAAAAAGLWCVSVVLGPAVVVGVMMVLPWPGRSMARQVWPWAARPCICARQSNDDPRKPCSSTTRPELGKRA
eukprot:1155344-Pelagomonas_calceolata.AAC.5